MFVTSSSPWVCAVETRATLAGASTRTVARAKERVFMTGARILTAPARACKGLAGGPDQKGTSRTIVVGFGWGFGAGEGAVATAARGVAGAGVTVRAAGAYVGTGVAVGAGVWVGVTWGAGVEPGVRAAVELG